MKAKETGWLAEKIAAGFLGKKGYRILHTNYRTYIGEIDIIATSANELVFVEVRSKTGNCFGRPEESINQAKKKKLIALSRIYCQQHTDLPENYRIDIVAIMMDANGKATRIEHIINAIEANGFF